MSATPGSELKAFHFSVKTISFECVWIQKPFFPFWGENPFSETLPWRYICYNIFGLRTKTFGLYVAVFLLLLRQQNISWKESLIWLSWGTAKGETIESKSIGIITHHRCYLLSYFSHSRSIINWNDICRSYTWHILSSPQKCWFLFSLNTRQAWREWMS